jgi:hypothetical protein
MALDWIRIQHGDRLLDQWAAETEVGMAHILKTDAYAGYGRNDPMYRLNFPSRESALYDSLQDAMNAADDPSSATPLRMKEG